MVHSLSDSYVYKSKVKLHLLLHGKLYLQVLNCVNYPKTIHTISYLMTNNPEASGNTNDNALTTVFSSPSLLTYWLIVNTALAFGLATWMLNTLLSSTLYLAPFIVNCLKWPNLPLIGAEIDEIVTSTDSEVEVEAEVVESTAFKEFSNDIYWIIKCVANKKTNAMS